VSTRFNRPELDVLRFGAFLLIFLHHALPHSSAEYPMGAPLAPALAAVARSGALGVDLFFALSSYLITELLLREHRSTGSINIQAFYIRRILRIWPLYFFALLMASPSLPWGYLAAFALLSGNWVCATAGFPASPFTLLWSVSIEEQFYLVWPWVVRGQTRRIATCAWIMLAVASTTRIFLAANGTTHPGVWCNTLTRLDPFAAGTLLACYGKQARGHPLCIIAGAVALVVTGGIGAHDGWGSIVTYPLAAGAAVTILHGSLGMGWNNRALAYLGKISYGLYVFHVAAIEFAGPIAALPLTIVLAALSYRYLESPFLRLKERFSGIATDTTLPLEQLRKPRTTSVA
jgi:peptidoglycan/LPS O-acetylase OafA/YrhL